MAVLYPYHVKIFCKDIDIFALNNEFDKDEYEAISHYETFFNILTHGDIISQRLVEDNGTVYIEKFELFSTIALLDLINYSDDGYCDCRWFKHLLNMFTDYKYEDFYNFEVGYFLSFIRNANKKIYDFYKNKYSPVKYDKLDKIVKNLNDKFKKEGKIIDLEILEDDNYPIIFMHFSDKNNIKEDIEYAQKYVANMIIPYSKNDGYVGIKGVYYQGSCMDNICKDCYGHILSYEK